METNKFYGIKTNALTELNTLQVHIEEIVIQGYTVIENYLTDDETQKASLKIDAIYQQQVESFGEDNLRQIKELNLVRSPLLYDDLFLYLINKPILIDILKCFLGDYFIINQQNGIINFPNEIHHQSAWHRDLPYQDYIISKPIAISALCCLDDFNEQTGGTSVLPFTHQLSAIPSTNYIDKHKLTVNAKKGSMIIFNAMLYHKAGSNTSQIIRRGLNTLFSIPLLAQQINLAKSLNGKFSDDKFFRRLLGYDSQIPDNIDMWRFNRLNR